MKPAVAWTIAAIGMAAACSHALAQNALKEGEKVLLEGAKSQITPSVPGAATTGAIPGAAGAATSVPGAQGVTTSLPGTPGATTMVPGVKDITGKVSGVPGTAAAVPGTATTVPGAAKAVGTSVAIPGVPGASVTTPALPPFRCSRLPPRQPPHPDNRSGADAWRGDANDAASGFAVIPIGLGLTLIHLVSIPVTNTSVNPARSTGTTLVAGGAYVIELWLFWAAPIIGAIIAGLLARRIYEREALIQTMLWRKAGSLSAILQAGRLRPPGFTVDR